MREAITIVAIGVILCGPHDDASAQSVSRGIVPQPPLAPLRPWTEGSPADPAPPLGVIASSIASAIRKLPSRETALTLGIAGVLSAAALPIDGDVTARASRHTDLDALFEPGDVLGEAWTHVGGALGTLWLGGITGNRRLREFGVDLARAQAVTAVYGHTLKIAAGRTRPNGGSRSFPSGHASASFTAATVIRRHFGLKAGIPAYVIASYVAVARLQQNSHYPSDLIFGAGLGLASGRSITVRRGLQRFVVAPVATSGGMTLVIARQ